MSHNPQINSYYNKNFTHGRGKRSEIIKSKIDFYRPQSSTALKFLEWAKKFSIVYFTHGRGKRSEIIKSKIDFYRPQSSTAPKFLFPKF